MARSSRSNPPGAWMFKNRQVPASRFVNPCSTPGAAAMNVPGVARVHAPSMYTSSSPSRM